MTMMFSVKGLKSDLEAINRRELSVSEYNPSILKDYSELFALTFER